MKTRYKILLIIGIIFAIYVTSIITIDFIYANQNKFTPIFEMMCSFITIPDDFEANQIFFANYQSDPIEQLGMIEYGILDTCAKIKDPSLIWENRLYEDKVNNLGCPQFCPKIDEELQKELKIGLDLVRETDIPLTLSGRGIGYVIFRLAEPNTEYENKIADIMGDLPYKIDYGEGVKRGT